MFETTRPLRILHLANHHSTNIGNGALIHGLERTVSEDFERSVQFQHEAWDDYTIPEAPKEFGPSFVELCRDVDCLVVGAAVTFVGSPAHQYTGMRFNLPLELWDEIECPIVFYGLSYRTWPGQAYHHRDRLRAAIEYALQHDRCLFSVRNDGTRAWLGKMLEMDVSGIQEVPDPALFVGHSEQGRPWPLHPERLNLAVSLNDEDSRFRFGGVDAPVLDRLAARLHPSRHVRRSLRRTTDRRMGFVERMAQVLDRLARQYPAEIILCPHHHEDFRMIADFFGRCSSRLKHQIVSVNGLPKSERAREFYNFYRNVDLTLAMRVHAMSPSIGLGTPTLALCSQQRMTEFMDDAGLCAYRVDAFSADFEEELRRRCEWILAHPAKAREEIQSAVEKMRHRTRNFNRALRTTRRKAGATCGLN